VDYFAITAHDRVFCTAPFHFDMSTFDVFAAQRAGAALCIASAEEILFPAKLAARLESSRATVWKAISSLLSYLVTSNVVGDGRFGSLRHVIFAGEKLPTKYLIEWMRSHPACAFYNGYGPTEATGVSICHRIDRAPGSADEVIPIGTACANSEAIVLRDDGTRADPGEPGEICIRGSCLGAGYWGDPDKTRRAFIRNPLASDRDELLYRTGDVGFQRGDGALVLTARLDEQVKYQGYRIELGEIAHAVQALPDVRDAAVLLLRNAADTDELVAFVDAPAAFDAGSLRSALRGALPDYMIPKGFVAHSPLPRTDRGKVDKKALEALYRERAAKVAP
jgi:non-ribosomal peptide synthetase component F